MAKQTAESQDAKITGLAINWGITITLPDGTSRQVGEPGIYLNFLDPLELARTLNEKPYAEQVAELILARFKETFDQNSESANRLISKL